MKQFSKVFFVIAMSFAPVFLHAQTMLINTVAGNGTDGFSGDGGPATAAQFRSPSDLALDAAGNIYVADNRNHRIRKIDAATGIISTIAGQGVAAFGGDGGPATAAYIGYPTEVKLDAAGNIYITEQQNKRIRKITSATGIISTIAGGGSSAYYYDGMPGTSLGSTFRPGGLNVDAAGNCYFLDSLHAPRVVRLDAVTGILTTVICRNGESGFSGDGGPAVDAKMDNLNYYPGIGTAIDASGNVYATDIYNFRIRKVDNSTGIISTFAGNGSMGTVGDGGPATAANIGLVYRPTIDNAGNFYFFSDIQIRKIDAITNTISTLGGGGTSYAEGIPATAARLYSPYGLAVDAAQNVYYVDNDGRVRKLTPGCSSVVPGSIVSSAGNAVCPGTHTTLSLTGVSTAQDISYQWRSSTDGITWTNAGTDSTSYTTIISDTVYFKALVTCNTGGITDSTAIDTINILPHSVCNTGVQTKNGITGIQVYPNPSAGSFSIYAQAVTNTPIQATITNVLGEQVKTLEIPANKQTTVQLDVAPGIYMLCTQSAGSRTMTKIIVTR